MLSITDSTIPSSLPSLFQSPILITRLRFSGEYVLKSEQTGEPLPFTSYKITTEEREEYNGVSDKDGKH